MTVIRISELSQDEDGSFRIKVCFGDNAEYRARVTNPADEAAEKRLAWYFEEHLRFPFLDRDLEDQAVGLIARYGESLFGQVFGGEAGHDYRNLKAESFDRCRLEVSGSAGLHRLHWEALRDPDLGVPLSVRMPVTRRVADQPSGFMLRDGLATLNILVITARPDGPRDVGYRTISRPLLSALRTAGLPVTVDLVRPGTWDALREHLQSATERHGSGWYHVAHFDLHGAFRTFKVLEAERQAGRLWFSSAELAGSGGRQGYLFFETAKDEQAQPVSAGAVASLLEEHRVPVAVLNACQSAMQSGSEAGLAQRLAEAGVPVAVGMAFSVTVSAAERAMPVLYRRIADGQDLAAGVTAARRDLLDHPARQAYFGQDLDLADWMLPVMFAQRPLQIRLRPMGDAEQRQFYEREAAIAREPATEYGFVGRDLDIQAIEHRLLATPHSNQLLVQGMAGAGKSTLLRHVAWWWQRTGLADQVFAFSYEDRAWTAAQIVREIRARLMSPADHARADTMSEAAQAEQVAGLLRAARHLLILDNAESITAAPAAIPHSLTAGERDKLATLLGGLRGGRTLVLIGSRGSEEWLTGSLGPAIYPLPGLDPQAASLLADKILARHHAARWLDDDTERAALQNLTQLLGGSPLPLTVVLPVLASIPPTRVLAELRSGEPGADPAGLITRAIEYSHGKLNPAIQNSLLVLAPFTGAIPMGPAMDLYRELLREQEAVETLGEIDLTAAISQAVSVGLASPHTQLSGIVQVQPVLPYFLRSRLRKHRSLYDALELAHYQLHLKMSAALLHMLDSRDNPRRRIIGRATCRAEYANFTAALEYGLRTGKPIATLIETLEEYLDQTEQPTARRALVDNAIATHTKPVDKGQQEGLASLHGLAGGIALSERRLRDAKKHFQTSLKLYQSLDDRKNQAAALSQLGNVAMEEGRLKDAETSYGHTLSIAREIGDMRGVGSSHIHLGTIAREQLRYDDAESHYKEALDVFATLSQQHGAANCYYNLGDLALLQGHLEKAKASYQKALPIFGEFGDRRGVADSLGSLGNVAAKQLHLEDAEANYREALGLYLEFSDSHRVASLFHELAKIAKKQGRSEEAETNYHKAADTFAETDDRKATAQVYYELGQLTRSQDRFDDAEANCRRALDMFLAVGDQRAAAEVHTELGDLAQDQGRFDDAEASYHHALDLPVAVRDKRTTARVHTGLALLASRQRRLNQAADYLSMALKIFLDLGDLNAAAATHHHLGNLAARQQLLGEAETHYREALDIWQGMGDQNGVGRAHHSLAVLASHQGRLEDADTWYRNALEAFLKVGDLAAVADAYHDLGTVAQQQGRFQEAETDYRRALDIFLETGDRKRAADEHHNLGAVASRDGRVAEAKASYRRALDIRLETGDQDGAAKVHYNLALLAEEQGSADEAVASHRRALDIFLETDRKRAAEIYNSLALLANQQGRVHEAEAHYRHALDLCLETGNHSEAARSHVGLGQISEKQDRLKEAEGHYRHALDILQEAASRQVAAIHFQLGVLALKQGNLEDGEANYLNALDIFLQSDDRKSVAATSHELALIASQQGRLEDAEARYRAALDIYVEIGEQSVAAVILGSLGVLARKRGHLEEAEASYQRALDIYLEIGDEGGAAATYREFAVLAVEQGCLEKAEPHYHRALDIYLKISDQDAVATIHYGLGLLAQQQRRFEKAEGYLRRALDVFSASSQANMSITAGYLGIVLDQLDRHIEAARMLIYAAVNWRQLTGNWSPRHLQWLKRERRLIGADEFGTLAQEDVPEQLAREFADAIEQAAEPN